MKESQAIILSGKPAAPGIGIGKAWILEEESKTVRPVKIRDDEIQENLDKFKRAKELTEEEYKKIKSLSDEYEALEIIDAQIQALNDPEVSKSVAKKISDEKYTVDYAIFSTFNDYIQLLESSDVTWANERTIDIVSIRDELIQATRSEKKGLTVQEGEIVFAEDIPPTTMVKLSRTKIAGIVMEKGGLTSHAVILSQSLGIPCVINTRWNKYNLQNRKNAIIDGSTGQVILGPSWKQTQEYIKRKEDEALRFLKALEWADKPNKTLCGSEFTLRANVEFLEELPRLKTHGAKGVGLLRTETILFDVEDFDVEDQIKFYSQILQAADGESVTIRLFDAGGDKLLDNSDTEANPFLGWRGIRMLLDKKELLRKQLEAIYSVSGNFKGQVKILIPMVTNLDEVVEVKKLAGIVTKSMNSRNISFDEELKMGVMVEVPSVALMAGHIARHVDYFSIGTNDLTQYTLAVDRGNQKTSGLFDSFHPAIWKLIKMTKDAADRQGIPVSVCGEMASKPEAAACLLGMGINDLSMNAGSLPIVKSVLCSHKLDEMKQLAEQVLQAEDLKSIHALLEKWRAV